MAGKEWPQIEIIKEAASKRDYCKVALDDETRTALSCLLILENQLSQVSLPVREMEGIVLAHTIIWSRLPYYYRSELADLSAITA